MRNKIVLFITGCISIMLISCLDSDNYTDSIIIKDAQIRSFVLKHDSIAGLSKVFFTIDQLSGQIFNKDSLPYGTELDKVVCTLTYVRGVLNTQVTQEVIPDSTYYWNGTDSLDFSKPVKFVTTAYDGQTTKTYIAKVNIHTVVPDSMVWELYTDKMLGYTVDEQKVIHTTYNNAEVYFMYVKSSTGYQLYYTPVSDLRNWTELTLTGLPASGLNLSQIELYEDTWYMASTEGELYTSTDAIGWTAVESPTIKSILGVVNESINQSSSLAVIVDNEDDLHFAGLNREGEWTTGDLVMDGFPLSGFGNITYSNMYHEYLVVAAGKDKNGKLINTSWSSMNALTWTRLTNENRDYYKEREGVMLTKYDDKFCLLGGITEDNKASKEIYFSNDYGVTWQLSDTLVVFPEAYKGRGFSSVIVDTDNYMLLFGGKTATNTKPLDELWRGRINRLGFKD